MTWILADVGGTNVRFARSDDLKGLTAIQRWENDAFSGFDDALNTYLGAENPTTVSGLCIAVAGPVTGRTARLTNRDWQFDATALSGAHRTVPVHLINDLSALGYAVEHLPDTGLHALNEATVPPQHSEQRLVIGIGTGLNVSPVSKTGGDVVCTLAEAGLVSPSARVLDVMRSYVGAQPEWVTCVEDVISGPGLGRLHQAATGTLGLTGGTVSEAATSGDAAALRTLDVFARMIGALVQDLRLSYMPSHGIYLAGSVLRGLLTGPARDRLIASCGGQPSSKSTLPEVPLYLITEDEAGLLGCLGYAVSAS